MDNTVRFVGKANLFVHVFFANNDASSLKFTVTLKKAKQELLLDTQLKALNDRWLDVVGDRAEAQPYYQLTKHMEIWNYISHY